MSEKKIPVLPPPENEGLIAKSEIEKLRKQVEDQAKVIEEQKQTIESQKALAAEAADVIKQKWKEEKASDEEERQRLIYKISRDSRGFLRKDQLSQLRLRDLRLINKNFQAENAAHYREYFERRRKERDAGKRRSGLTVGEYDSEKKRYKDD